MASFIEQQPEIQNAALSQEQPHPQPQTITEPAAPPPPYTPTTQPQPLEAAAQNITDVDTIEIDATTTVSGTGNIVTVGADAALMACRVAGALYAALDKQTRCSGEQARQRARPLRIRVDCGVRVVGARNVLGSVGVAVRNVTRLATGGKGDAEGPDANGHVQSGADESFVSGAGKRKAGDEELEDRASKAVKIEIVNDEA